MSNEKVFYAPNVHSGGGYTLLKELLVSNEVSKFTILYLDSRIRDKVELLDTLRHMNIIWVEPKVFSRIKAEYCLLKCLKNDDVVFCFHGLPPILFNGCNIIVFLQNRLYISGWSVKGLSFFTAIRLTFERLINKFFKCKVKKYVVQSNTMKSNLIEYFGDKIDPNIIDIKPFCSSQTWVRREENICDSYDFVYIADGLPHKNHINLLGAWIILANFGFRPSLFLTVPQTEKYLLKMISESISDYDCNIVNVGAVNHDCVLSVLSNSKALIYPSFVESFGLPLLEAKAMGLPIISSEKDYVRDIVDPQETFDPNSSLSIARAVMRFLNVKSRKERVYSPSEFLQSI